MSQTSLIAWITAGAVLMLVAAYGIGAPFLLLRTALDDVAPPPAALSAGGR